MYICKVGVEKCVLITFVQALLVDESDDGSGGEGQEGAVLRQVLVGGQHIRCTLWGDTHTHINTYLQQAVGSTHCTVSGWRGTEPFSALRAVWRLLTP